MLRRDFIAGAGGRFSNRLDTGIRHATTRRRARRASSLLRDLQHRWAAMASSEKPQTCRIVR